MDYVDAQARAQSMLGRAGLKVTITRDGNRVGSGHGVFVSTATKNAANTEADYMAQTTVTARTVLLSGLMKAPQPGDTLTADKQTYTVAAVELVRPATVTVLYRCEVH